MFGRPLGMWGGWYVVPEDWCVRVSFKSGVDMNGRSESVSKGVMTSLATLRTDLMPRSTRPRQSRLLSSLPSQIPGRTSMGPSAYGTVGEPSPSSSLR